MMFSSVCFILLIYFVVPLDSTFCPCVDAPQEFDHKLSRKSSNASSESMMLCVANALAPEERLLKGLGLVDISVHFITYSDQIPTSCDVLARVIYQKQAASIAVQRHLCPGICRPVPEFEFMAEWLVEGTNRSEIVDYLTCTLTSSMVVSSDRVIAKRKGNLGGELTQSTSITAISDIVRAIFWRRIMECFEKKFWYERYAVTTALVLRDRMRTTRRGEMHQLKIEIPRRKILCIVIWIGSLSKLRLIQDQAEVLRDQPSVGITGVIAWAATDEVHPCRADKITCLKRGRTKCLPQSAINFMPKGWGCAQRRPLRSLAHTLLLVDPTFAIVLDDDTYLNFKLLLSKYGTYLTHGAMSQRPLVIGELGGTWGDTGHLTKWGIFAGGAGYIIGHRALQALTAHEIKYYRGEGPGVKAAHLNGSDLFRSNQHIHHLSVYKEGLEVSQQYCEKSVKGHQSTSKSDNHANSCVLTTTPAISSLSHFTATASSSEHHQGVNLMIPIAVRLIDFCVNLMANEHTCLHSDHSMGRCLVYGAFIDPVSSACHSTAPIGSKMTDPLDPTDAIGVKVGQCFMTPLCDLAEQIMCHRYKPHKNMSQAVRINKPGYYRVYSSVYNGSETDTFM